MKNDTGMNWQYGIATHQGTVRTINEDSVFLRIGKGKNIDIALAIIADGMGGHDAGEVASGLTIERIKKWWDKRIYHILQERNPLKKINDELEEVINKINNDLVQIANSDSKRMGTTISLILLLKEHYIILHVGDSRIYIKKSVDHDEQTVDFSITEPLGEKIKIKNHDHLIEQLTEDQSWVESQVTLGKLTKEQARNHPKRNVLLQCLGLEPGVEIIKKQGRYSHNELVLLCSDGFYSLFPDEDISRMINNMEAEGNDLQSISEYLLGLAIEVGADDNISVILIKKATPSESTWKKIFRWFE